MLWICWKERKLFEREMKKKRHYQRKRSWILGDMSVETMKGKDMHSLFFTNPQQGVVNRVANENDGPIKDEDGYGIQSVLHRNRC